MAFKPVRVPAALILDPTLTPAAKLVWMALALCALDGETPVGPSRLRARSGLSRPTIRKALAQLAAAAWAAQCPAGGRRATPPPGATPASGQAAPQPTGGWVAQPRAAGAPHPTPGTARSAQVPGELLTEHQLRPLARVLYAALQLTPGFRHPGGDCTAEGLMALMHTGRKSVQRAVRELVQAGWLRPARRRRIGGFTLINPVLALGREAASAAEWRLQEARHKGEALMREYLSLLVDSDNFADNVAPGFLVNPITGERMQFDRFYPPRVAFEFNGPQHFRPTRRFSLQEVKRQQTRDLIKLGICVQRGIHLVTVVAADLSLETMRQKVSGLLPLRDLAGCDALIGALERAAEQHRLRAQRTNLDPAPPGPRRQASAGRGQKPAAGRANPVAD